MFGINISFGRKPYRKRYGLVSTAHRDNRSRWNRWSDYLWHFSAGIRQAKAMDRLIEVLTDHYRSECGRGNIVEGETALETAARLLRNHNGHIKYGPALADDQFRLANFLEEHFPTECPNNAPNREEYRPWGLRSMSTDEAPVSVALRLLRDYRDRLDRAREAACKAQMTRAAKTAKEAPKAPEGGTGAAEVNA